MKKALLFRLAVLVAAMMCALGARAELAYACYTPENTTLTFYYDNLQDSRPGMIYDLNLGSSGPSWWLDGTCANVTKVVFNSSFANARPTSTCSWFRNMRILESITGLSYLNTIVVTNMSNMFDNCSGLTSLDLSSFDTSMVTDMKGMFYDCSSLTSLNLSSFNTYKVTDMSSMFRNCSSLTSLNLSSFDTYEVTDMSSMFRNCSSLTSLNLSSFNTSRVTEMDYMFLDCTGLTSLDLSSFNTSKVTDMRVMFNNCSSLTSLDLSSFNTANVTSMFDMFSGCSNLQTITVGSDWSTAAVTNSSLMFTNCTSLVGGMGTVYNDSNPKDKTYAHIDGGASNPGYFTAEGTEAYACYTPMSTTLTFYYDNQRSSRPGTTYDLNTGTSNPGWYKDNTYRNVTLVKFDASFAGARPTSTFEWFYGMNYLLAVWGMNYLNTSQVTDMSFMFFGCSLLPSIDLSSFNTAKVTDMRYMFCSCNGLKSLDLSSFNTSNVTDMADMFLLCGNLQTIIVGSD